LRLHERGKQTLVLGEHRSAVRFSDEGGNACPNYWHFSPYGFCPYGCHYCYLAGTPGVRFSPAVKIFLNLDEILGEVDRTATQLGRPTAFYLGKLQDGLALEPLSGYARTMVPFFAQHPYARMVILTKSADVENLVHLHHAGRTILSWTVNAPEVTQRFERNTPDVMARLDAMRRCAQAGYPVRAVVMPIIPVAGWQKTYARFIVALLESVALSRVTLGCICSYPQAQRLMELKLGEQNAISTLLDRGAAESDDGRLRFSRTARGEVYRYLIGCIRRQRPDLEVGLCLEDEAMFVSLDLTGSMGRCNCVL
jgi:spore photoproduct lyase